MPTSRDDYDLLFNYQIFLEALIGHHLQVREIVWNTNNGDIIKLGYDFDIDWIFTTAESIEVQKKIRSALENQKTLPKVLELKVLRKTLTSNIGFIHCEIL